MNRLTKHHIEKYLSITKVALEKVKIAKEKPVDWKKSAQEFFDMAQRYYDDAVHFYNKGDPVNAFAAVNYAHGWLDAGARLGLFDVGGDSKLFSVD